MLNRTAVICIIKNTLLILKDNGLYFIDLTDKIANEKITQINDNRNKYTKLLKVNNECCVILNEEEYKLLTV